MYQLFNISVRTAENRGYKAVYCLVFAKGFVDVRPVPGRPGGSSLRLERHSVSGMQYILLQQCIESRKPS